MANDSNPYARSSAPKDNTGFVHVRGGRFMIDDRPFRFTGANVAVMYRDEDRAHMPETMRRVS